jgi:hypothetical protein
VSWKETLDIKANAALMDEIKKGLASLKKEQSSIRWKNCLNSR